MISRLYLVRHGRAAPPGVLAGQADYPLTYEGETQARAVGELLAAVPLSRAWSSPLLRARQTAEHILAANGGGPLQAALVPELAEICLGCWQGQSKEWIRQRYPDEWRARGRDIANVAPPGGESLAALAARVLPAFARLADEAGEHAHSLLVAHQAVNRLILARCLDVSLEKSFDIPQPLAAVSVLLLEKDGIRLERTLTVGE